MNIELELMQADKTVKELMEAGYTRLEAIQLIQAAAVTKLSKAVYTDYNGKSYLYMHGSVATYEQ